MRNVVARFVLKAAVIGAAMAFSGAAASAQEHSATRALAHIMIAKQYCGLDAPSDLARSSVASGIFETGMSFEQYVPAVAQAAAEMGRVMRYNGTLVGFCNQMAGIYAALGR